MGSILDFKYPNGLELIVEESKSFDRTVKGVYEITSKEVYGSDKTPNIALFAYGSPARIEMVGGDSDADIFLVEKERTKKSQKFKYLLKERLKSFDFSKIDIPPWGSLEEIKVYLDKSLVEGNQILETRYLAGDKQVVNELTSIKSRFDSIERAFRNIIFNRFYFNQYFQQRTNNGAKNIKYCSGGSRDFLFVYWNDKLDRMLCKDKEDTSYRPRVEVGLKKIYEKEKISKKELEEGLDAVNFLSILRSDVLRMNKNTPDKGLTFLDKKTLENLQSIGYPLKTEIKKEFENHRKAIEGIIKKIWKDTTKKIEGIKGLEWGRQFRLAYTAETPVKIRSQIPSDDPLMRLALIWGSNNSGQKNLFRHLADRYKDTEDWATIGSIVCSPYCESSILKHFGTGQAKQGGYGYLLRVIARNKNVDKVTLESIANDKTLGERYKEVAIAALNGGYGEANRQI